MCRTRCRRWRVETFDDVVDRGDETVHEVGELRPLIRLELAEDVHHRCRSARRDGVVAAAALVGDSYQDDATVLRGREPFDQAVVLQALHGSRRRGRLDTQACGEFLHRTLVSPGEQIECIHLPLLELLLGAEQVRAQCRRRGAPAEFDPGSADSASVLAIGPVAEVDGAGSGG